MSEIVERMESVRSIALMTVLAGVALLSLSAGSAAAASQAGMGITAAGILTPIPGDAVVGTTIFVKSASAACQGPGGCAVKIVGMV